MNWNMVFAALLADLIFFPIIYWLGYTRGRAAAKED